MIEECVSPAYYFAFLLLGCAGNCDVSCLVLQRQAWVLENRECHPLVNLYQCIGSGPGKIWMLHRCMD